MIQVITNAQIFTGESVLANQNILVENGKIISIETDFPSDAEVINLNGKNIASGFIDIQINGGKNKYFSQTPDEETLSDIYEVCRNYGTPFILPTLISSPLDVILKAIDAVRKFRDRHSSVLGMHLEGPFLNPLKHGAHDPKIIRKPTNEALQKIIENGKDVIKVITIAPECFTDEQIEMLLASGIIISAGHSEMNYDQAQRYFNKGIHLVTHLFNAMTQLGHRECGTVGAVFDNDKVFAPIILDGGHCHYAAARIALKQKNDKLFLITDSSFLGRQKKRFIWEGLNIEMINDYYRDMQGNLAGAAISMPEAVKNAMEHLNVPLQDAIEMATSRVARAIKMDDEIGFIKSGYPATFVVFDNELSAVESLLL
jgi:N-acetylglucosamine-6-phosphate deacetylase